MYRNRVDVNRVTSMPLPSAEPRDRQRLLAGLLTILLLTLAGNSQADVYRVEYSAINETIKASVPEETAMACDTSR